MVCAYVPFSTDIDPGDLLTKCLKFASHSVLGSVSRKSRKHFGALKAVFSSSVSEKCPV